MKSHTPKNQETTKFHVVTHCFWRYPIVAGIVTVAVILLGMIAGSPNWPQATIKKVTTEQPGGTLWAVAQELDRSSSSYTNTQEYGMVNPATRLVVDPLKSASWALAPNVNEALSQFLAQPEQQQVRWAMNYDNAIRKALKMGSMGGAMSIVPVPSLTMLSHLHGNFGPVPVIANGILQLARNGYLQNYFQGISPGNTFEYVNIWLYDQPYLLNTAIKNGLTDDQWGMIKERGFFVGPWYLIVPAIAHVLLPGGSSGPGFILWNALIAFFFIVLFPLIPGLRDIPRYLKLYKLIYATDNVQHSPLVQSVNRSLGDETNASI